MTKQVKSTKPPAQGVGVQGFKADLYASDIPRIEWGVLIHLPKFQMYAVEMAGSAYGDVGNVMEWILGYVQDLAQTSSEQQLFDDYAKWHADKGYWNHESLYGVILND